MDYLDVLLPAVTLAVGWIGGKLADRKNGRNGNGKPYPFEALEAHTQQITLENSHLRQTREELQVRLLKTEKRIFTLEQKLQLLEAIPNELPFPMWMKDPLTGKMDYVNDRYEELFLTPLGLTSEDYVGKTDHDIWPKEIADEFRKNDLDVFQSKQVFVGYEMVPDNLGRQRPWRIVKYIRWAAAVPVGIAGIALPEGEHLEDYLKRKR